MIKMHNTPPWVDSVRMNFDYILNHIGTKQNAVTDAGAVTKALNPGEIYNFSGAVTSLTITLNEVAGEAAHYHFTFISGSPAATLTLPVDVVMPDGFSVEANKRYEVDILDNYGTVMSWTNS